MDPMLNTSNEEQQASLNSGNEGSEKSDLMQFFENRVNDAYWAYRDLLKEILDGDVKGVA